VPARGIRAGQQVQLQVDGEVVTIRAVGSDGAGWLATHPRARQRGSWVVDQTHWDGLPDGHTRAVVIEPAVRSLPTPSATGGGLESLSSLLARRHADIPVAARSLTDYDTAAAMTGVTR
jgi:hypothetical protein